VTEHPNSWQRFEDVDWFVDPRRFARATAEQMNASIHTEQRLAAMHKVCGTPLGPDYLDALRGCVRLNAQLGFVDAGLPMARRLLELLDGGQPPGLAAGAYSDLGALAHACRVARRFGEALDLDAAVTSWFGAHRAEFGEHHVAAVSGSAADHAGLGDLDGAVTLLRNELEDPASPVRLHPFSRQAVRFVDQLKHYRRRARGLGHDV
jgi:hypothetical protein